MVGAVREPFNTPDFSSFLLQAKSSKAAIIGLANAGSDAINTIKQAKSEFAIGQDGRQTLVPLSFSIADTHALGLQKAQDLSVHRCLLLGPHGVDPSLVKALL